MKIERVLLFFCLILACSSLEKVSVNAADAPEVVITEIAGWNHPVKKVFQEAGVVVKRVELSNNKTYPKFYVSFSQKFNMNELDSRRYFFSLLQKVAKANSFFDYEVIDESKKLQFEIFCEKFLKTVRSIDLSIDFNKYSFYSSKIYSGVITNEKKEIYFGEYTESKRVKNNSIIGETSIEFRICYTYSGDIDLDELKKGLLITIDGKEVSDFITLNPLEHYNTRQNNTEFAGFEILISNKLPKGILKIVLKEGTLTAPLNKDNNIVIMEPFELELENLAINNPKPIMLMSMISANDDGDGGWLSLESAVDSDGVWRAATSKNAWQGQRFDVYEIIDATKTLKKTSDIICLDKDFNHINCNFKRNVDFIGIYSSGKSYQINSTNKIIKPKELDKVVADFLCKDYDGVGFLKDVVKIDIKNINADFKNIFIPVVNETMISDLNGDGKKDYVLIVGSNYDDVNPKPVAIVAYVSKQQGYRRIPLDVWEKPGFDGDGWPKMFFTYDFNGDKRAEVVLKTKYMEMKQSLLIVYSWFDDGMKMIYFGEMH